jgi:hypothetical protein
MSAQHQDIHTLHITSNDFYAGYQRASLDYELTYKPRVTTCDDIQITSIFTHVAYGTHSDLWKAGYHAGFFAALSGIPCIWTFGPVTNDVQYGITSIRGMAA